MVCGARVKSLEPARAAGNAPGCGLAGGVRADLSNSGRGNVMTDVIGTWRLVKAVARDASGKELAGAYGGEWAAPYGAQPMGRIVLGADGRMMALACDNRKEVPADEKREYGGYCRNYTY